MSAPRPSGGGANDPRAGRIAALARTIAALFAVAALLLLADIARSAGDDPFALAALLALIVVAALAFVYRRDVFAQEGRQRVEAESLNRMLQGLSRSTSPEAVLGAIVDELRRATGADHCVVVRRRPRSRLVEATLISGSSGAPHATTTLPVVLLDVGPGDSEAAEAVASRISDAAGELFGLQNRRAAALVTSAGPIGALVLSQRRGARWSPAAVRLLHDAAKEASAALERAYAHAATEQAASTDPLTGLPNRRFLEILAAQPPGRRREDARAVLMVDIDHFKRVNDRFGHDLGDEVLRAVADAIARTVRTDDFPIRYGGEEFLIVLARADRDIAQAVAERLRRNVGAIDRRRFNIPWPLTVSVGVAVTDPAGSGITGPGVSAAEPLDTLITRADAALYRAKSSGRDRVVVA